MKKCAACRTVHEAAFVLSEARRGRRRVRDSVTVLTLLLLLLQFGAVISRDH